MHLQQTKRGSLDTGGAQYYFHELSEVIKVYLRKKGAVRVALVTPYGATKSDYFAVSKDHKLDSAFRPVPGSVGHDRIQQGHANESIGESIRAWYGLPNGNFERIDVDVEIRENELYLTPFRFKYAARRTMGELPRMVKPLSLTHDYRSPLWISQLKHLEKRQPGVVKWAVDEIIRVVRDHKPQSKLPHIQEPDLLRASGPLKHLGVQLGGYVGKGYDCITEFQFLTYPQYVVPVEIKRNSAGFKYQEQKYGKELLSRAVVLCALHDHRIMPAHIDVIELDAFGDLLRNLS